MHRGECQEHGKRGPSAFVCARFVADGHGAYGLRTGRGRSARRLAPGPFQPARQLAPGPFQPARRLAPGPFQPAGRLAPGPFQPAEERTVRGRSRVDRGREAFRARLNGPSFVRWNGGGSTDRCGSTDRWRLHGPVAPPRTGGASTDRWRLHGPCPSRAGRSHRLPDHVHPAGPPDTRGSRPEIVPRAPGGRRGRTCCAGCPRRAG